MEDIALSYPITGSRAGLYSYFLGLFIVDAAVGQTGPIFQEKAGKRSANSHSLGPNYVSLPTLPATKGIA